MSHRSQARSLAWARLLRVPNLFTAQADVYVGLIATNALLQQPLAATALIFSSTALYAGGVVLNDVVDIAEDRRDRPSRPLPSGAVSFARATAAACGLLAGGVALAMLASLLAQRTLPIIISIALTATILTYDLRGKRSAAGPFQLGLCRFLNVLLGWSLTLVLLRDARAARAAASIMTPLLAAGAMGSYVWALSALAKHETTGLPLGSARRRIAFLIVPCGLLAALVVRRSWGQIELVDAIPAAMCAALILACVVVLRRVWRASSAAEIGRAVGGLLALIILLDATMIAILGHELAALLVLALYAPVFALRRQIYMT